MKKLPAFKNQTQENRFWAKRDSTDFIDWAHAKTVVLPNLKPSTRSISLRLPESLLTALRNLANKYDVPYQSLIKIILQEHLGQATT